MQPLKGLLPISLLGEQRHDGCEQFAKDCYPTASRLRFEPGPFCAWVQHANHSATESPEMKGLPRIVSLTVGNLSLIWLRRARRWLWMEACGADRSISTARAFITCVDRHQAGERTGMAGTVADPAVGGSGTIPPLPPAFVPLLYLLFTNKVA